MFFCSLVLMQHPFTVLFSPCQALTLPSHMEAPAYEESQSFSMRRPSPPPQHRRRRTTSDLNLFPRMALPGMAARLSQSLGLPGDGQARLLRIRRHNSLDSIPLNISNQQGDSGIANRRTSDTSRHPQSPQRQATTLVQDTGPTSPGRSPREASAVLRSDSQNSRVYPQGLTVQRHDQEIHRSLSDSSRHRPRHMLHRHSANDFYPPSSAFLHTIPLYPARPSIGGAALRTSYNGRELSRQRRRQAHRTRVASSTHSYNGPRRFWNTPQDRYGLPSHMAYLHLMDSIGTNGTGTGSSFPYPSEPPPPYTHCPLPPYVENDPAPSYRSRASPVPSI